MVNVQRSCPGGIAVWIRNLDHHSQHNQETEVIPQPMPKRNPGHYIWTTGNGEDYQHPNCQAIWYGGFTWRHHHCETPPLAWTPGKNGGWQSVQKVLFGWLPQPRPWHGTKMRWRDRVRKDLRKFDIDERTGYTEAQERADWRQKWHRGLESSTKIRLQEDEQRSATRRAARIGKHPADGDTSWQPFIRDTWKRSFRRSQDIAQHKCITTRPKHPSQRPPR